MSNSIELTTKAGVKIAVNAVVHEGGGGGGVTAHADLTGLATGDDHPQYQRSEAFFTSSSSFTITDQSVVITAGSAVTLPDAEDMAGRLVGVGAAAQTVTISPAGTDTMFDDPGNPYSLPSGNGITFVSVQISSAWGWAIYTRNGPAFDMPKWFGESLAEGKVLRVNSSGAPAWANVAAADVPSLAASKITSGTFDVARIPTGTTSTTVALGNDSRFTDARTPTAHKTSHATGGTDALAPSDIGAVPTTRTVNGSALTGDITVTATPSGSAGGDLTGTYPNPTIGSGKVTVAKLSATGTADSTTFLRGDGSWSTPSATVADGSISTAKIADSAVTTAKITDAAVTSAKVSGGLARQPVVAAAKVADTTSTSVYAGSSLVPVIGNTSATLALALGAVYLVRTNHDGATLNRLVLVVTASSLTAGQSVTLACFNDSGGTPTTRVWSQSVTIGTSTGAIITPSLSLTMPTGPCWVAILNPSGNAGTVTMRSHQTIGNFLTVANDASSAVVGLESQSSMPSDLSSYQLRTATTSGTFAVGNLASTFPKIIGNAS